MGHTSQCKLTGKAQEALSLDESLVHKKVKSSILREYELVPEAYRQHFQRRQADFTTEKEVVFDRWC